VLLSVCCASARPAPAQSRQPENKPADSIHGIVVNGVTHEPIGRALVYSPDNRFATMTDSEGRFEFTYAQSGSNQNKDDESGRVSYPGLRIPEMTARKPGFLNDRVTQSLQSGATGKELTLSLTPEALVVGRVVLPTSEASDAIQLEIYRRQVLEGRAHWILAGSASTKSNGEFRFAELPPGSLRCSREK
jgi:hypothetical protein